MLYPRFRTGTLALAAALGVCPSAIGQGPMRQLDQRRIELDGDAPAAIAGFDQAGVIRRLNHFQAPYGLAALNLEDSPDLTPIKVADAYLQRFGAHLSIQDNWLTGQGAVEGPEDVPLPVDQPPGNRIVFQSEKTIGPQTRVSYEQRFADVPVWQSGVSIVVVQGQGPRQDPYRVTSLTSTITQGVEPTRPGPDAVFTAERATPEALATYLGLPADHPPPSIQQIREFVYLYRAEDRLPPTPEGPVQEAAAPTPTLPLPPVPDSVEPGRAYYVLEVRFTTSLPDTQLPIEWLALVDIQTGTVLYLRPKIDGACAPQANPSALVLPWDPFSMSGNTTLTPTSPQGELNSLRVRVELPGLEAPSGSPPRRGLVGRFARLQDLHPPTAAAPRLEAPFQFDGDVDSDLFAAANAFYHVESTFLLIEEILAEEGTPMDVYFDGTAFPVPVDHRWLSPQAGRVNARAPGDNEGDGSGGFLFAYAAPTGDVSMAVDRRVVLHEFGHALLEDCLHWPNFPFAHSYGDSLAAILADPDSRSPNRFATFPWSPLITRRHDRPVVGGWGWGGSMTPAWATAAICRSRSSPRRCSGSTGRSGAIRPAPTSGGWPLATRRACSSAGRACWTR